MNDIVSYSLDLPAPKVSKLSRLSSYIVVMKKVIDNNICDEIIDHYASSNDWTPSAIASGQVEVDVRKVHQINMSSPSVIEKYSTIRSKLDNDVFNSAAKCISFYNQLFPCCTINIDTGYTLLRYNKGCFYKEHVDSFEREQRSVSCSFGLNDDYEGGEFSFFGGKNVVRVEKGDAILFPSSFQYPHRINEVTSGIRYSIVTWFV